ncbi:hypothetical protein Syun_022221 [Stephania yunnanensis]|uniref:Protein SAR DEFICIENT 1 n=1 Tax=Stephania yunnanensis TaxID=152371 RepID=A0AAP0IH31_9MAGN
MAASQELVIKRSGHHHRDDPDHDQPETKRIKTRPSLASVFGEALMMNSMRTFTSYLEPMLRRVVNEEMEQGLRRLARPIHSHSHSHSHMPSPLQLEGPEDSTFQLHFTRKLSTPVFTGSKIEDYDGNPVQIILVDAKTSNQRIPTSLPYPLKLEIVVLDGDFLNENQEEGIWTSKQFDEKIIRERTGKRPLITGDVSLTLRAGCASIGALTFTDNSSWIRSRTFRLGARVVHGSSNDVKIREAFTEAFVVKDHRGELYKKHHPPSLGDEVWRLEKIGKDGAFHKKLSSACISTVQELLKLWVVHPGQLRAILGNGMSDKMFEMTIKHARTCVLGNKHYLMKEAGQIIVLNPICQVAGVLVNGKFCGARELSEPQKMYVQKLVKVAYKQWRSLEEFEGQLNQNAALTSGITGSAEDGSITTRWSTDKQNDVSRSNQMNGTNVTYGSQHGEINAKINQHNHNEHNWPRDAPSPDIVGAGFNITDCVLEADLDSIELTAYLYSS